MLTQESIIITHVIQSFLQLDDKNEEINMLKMRLHDAETRCSQLDAKVRMQQSLESIKWEEFHKLANTMSELSRSMSPTKHQDVVYDE